LIVVYSPRYRIDIGPHVFPTEKYPRIHARLLETGVIRPSDVIEPAPASWDELALVHTTEYLDKMRSGALTPEDVAQLELPWSQAMVDGFRVMTGGTILAALLAVGAPRTPSPQGTQRKTNSAPSAVSAFNVVCHVGGGLHHAFPSHGEGFCPFNDVAVSARVLQARGLERIAIVDLDVHHGNGTAFIFESDPRVFTFSMHQQGNYPMWKPRGSRDIGLPDGAHDATYLAELERALPAVLAHRPHCVFYLAGADPYEDDQLGGLRLTKEGLRQRDRVVIDAVSGAGLPLVITLAGGYARRVEDTVAIHVATFEEAASAAARERPAIDRS
jgi:acetoin utilization deacetylase AcuC-like enzyme